MRLTCDVEIGNRLLPSFNMKGPGKSVRAQLSIGRRPCSETKDSTVYLMMCTAKDKVGTKYKLKGNVEKLFVKFVNQGKATIRLQEPPHDLIIKKADQVQLKSFLSVVKLGAQGGEDFQKITLSSLVPAKQKQVEKPKVKLTILSRKDYPLTTTFPSSLETLQVSQCSLKRLDTRILQLKALRILDLSDNRICTLPDDLNGLKFLTDLVLSRNKIADFPAKFWKGTISTTLRLLDLRNNQLKFFHPSFCELSGLITLKLDDNELLGFPQRFGDLKALRILTASNNEIQVLPPSFTALHLDTLDMSGNPFKGLGSGLLTTARLDRIPNLMEMAGRCVMKHRIPFGVEEVGGFLNEFLNSANWCLCGEPCLRSSAQYLGKVNMHHLAGTVSAINGKTFVRVVGYLCSHKCVSRYMENSEATMWK